MIDGWLSQMAEVIGNNMWLAPLLALLAGILTSVTPLFAIQRTADYWLCWRRW